ncbi:MAG: hypothetical protein FJ117_21495 [Deltaproteobacteria bacterium]|nr:hypothetical protein [Deltaproteobacteria bacterium]
MKREKSRIGTSVIILLMVLPFFQLLGEKPSESSEKPPEGILFLPRDDEIKGWKRDSEILTVPDPAGLFKIINGGASLYLKYGFQSYCGQTYKNIKGIEIELSIFNQGSSQKARQLYQDPLVVPKPGRTLEDLGDEARVDERGMFHYGIEFIKDRYFVRVIIQDKSEQGLNAAILFSRFVLQRIK